MFSPHRLLAGANFTRTLDETCNINDGTYEMEAEEACNLGTPRAYKSMDDQCLLNNDGTKSDLSWLPNQSYYQGFETQTEETVHPINIPKFQVPRVILGNKAAKRGQKPASRKIPLPQSPKCESPNSYYAPDNSHLANQSTRQQCSHCGASNSFYAPDNSYLATLTTCDPDSHTGSYYAPDDSYLPSDISMGGSTMDASQECTMNRTVSQATEQPCPAEASFMSNNSIPSISGAARQAQSFDAGCLLDGDKAMANESNEGYETMYEESVYPMKLPQYCLPKVIGANRPQKKRPLHRMQTLNFNDQGYPNMGSNAQAPTACPPSEESPDAYETLYDETIYPMKLPQYCIPKVIGANKPPKKRPLHRMQTLNFNEQAPSTCPQERQKPCPLPELPSSIPYSANKRGASFNEGCATKSSTGRRSLPPMHLSSTAVQPCPATPQRPPRIERAPSCNAKGSLPSLSKSATISRRPKAVRSQNSSLSLNRETGADKFPMHFEVDMRAHLNAGIAKKVCGH